MHLNFHMLHFTKIEMMNKLKSTCITCILVLSICYGFAQKKTTNTELKLTRKTTCSKIIPSIQKSDVIIKKENTKGTPVKMQATTSIKKEKKTNSSKIVPSIEYVNNQNLNASIKKEATIKKIKLSAKTEKSTIKPSIEKPEKKD